MTKNERFKEVVGALKFYNRCTQKEIVARLGCSPSYLSDVQRGLYEVAESFVDRLVASYPNVNKSYVMDGEGSPLLRVSSDVISEFSMSEKSEGSSDSVSVKPASTEDSVTIPSSAWKVIELQAESLAEKDRQTSRCIAMLEQSFELIKRGSVRVADATSADAATSEVG